MSSLPIRYEACPFCGQQNYAGLPRCPSCQKTIQYCAAASCRQPIYKGQRVQILPAAGTADMGEKSGQMICKYDHQESDLVHEGCVVDYYDPKKNKYIFDDFYNRMEKQIRAEVIEEVEGDFDERVNQEVGDRIHEELSDISVGRLCRECRAELQEYGTDGPATPSRNGQAPYWRPPGT